MAKTTPERESIIDAFDAIITFSYAYEWQKLQNNGIDELSYLADQIISEVAKEAIPLFMRKGEKFAAIFSILNKLQEAVVADSCPKAIKLGDFWLNKPKILSGEYLVNKYVDEFDVIVTIVMVVILDLHKLLPDEIKPFVTIEQVDAILTKKCDEMKLGFKRGKFRIPIHKERMASMLREYFINTYSIKQTTYEEVNAYEELAAGYCEEAIHDFVKMVEEEFYVRSVIKFFPLGKTIDVEIDRYYTWPQLCFHPMNYNKLLSIYSDNKKLFLNKGIQSIGDDAYLNVRLKKIIELGGRFSQAQRIPKGGVKRYMFDSNRDAVVVVDGKPIQNHLVMIFPYDKPVPGLQDKLNDYARYIGNRVNTYVREYGHTSGYEDEIKNAVAYRNIAIPYTRLSLSDASSVLPHIYALLCFEYERSSDNSGNLKKQQKLDVYEMIKNHEIIYSIESVESVRKEKEDRMLNIMEKLESHKG